MRDQTTRKVRPRNVPSAPQRDQTRKVGPRFAKSYTQNQGATLGMVPPGTILLGEYVVIATVHPHETTHPGLFRCVAHGVQDVMLKVAPSEHPPKPGLWEMLPELTHPNVVKTLKVVEDGGRFYEIQEFCQGGSLADCVGDSRIDAGWICDRFIPQVNEGLKYLHSKDIVHRDVKPANIYLRHNDLNGSIVLGDFDISSVLVSDRTSRHTNRTAGTWAYTAPEGFPRFIGDAENMAATRITRTADYYSLGITIIELLTGTTSLHSCGLPDLYDFYLMGGRVELPDAPASLLLLLKGLLIRNRHERWSGAEVDRWLQGANTREDMQAVINDQRFSLAKATRPFALGGQQAVDLTSLALAMERNAAEAKEHLLESDILTQWISNQDSAVAQKIERARERYRNSPDLALYRCIVLCDPNRPFDVPGYGTVTTVNEWPALLANKAPTERHLQNGPVSDYELGRLIAWLELKTDPDPYLATQLNEIRSRPLSTRFEEIAYLVDRKLPYSGQISAFLNLRKSPEEWQGGLTPKEIVAEAFGTSQDWELGHAPCFRVARDRWEQGHLDAWLRQRGMADMANKATIVAGILKGSVDEAFDTYLRHLDPWAEKPQIIFDEEATIGEKAIQYGDDALLSLPYRTIGVGFPNGSVRLDGAPKGVTLDTFRIRGRSGKLTVNIRTRGSRDTARQQFRIESDRGNFLISDDGVAVRYSINFPFVRTLTYAVVGAITGALLLGGSRGLLNRYFPDPINLRGITQQAKDPGTALGWFCAAAFCLAAIYLAFRVWLVAYKEIGR